MKKMSAVLFAVPLFLCSCASTSVDFSRCNPVAIMTIYSNPSVPWYDEKNDAPNQVQATDDGILTGVLNRAINRNNAESETAQSRIDEASELFSRRLREAGIAVIDPTVIQECSSYKNAGKNLFDYVGKTLPAAGYDVVKSSNGKLNKTMCEETTAKSVLYVHFLFQKMYVKDGVHNIGVAPRVVLSVYGVDSAGKKLVNREYAAVSPQYVPLVKTSSYDKDELCALFPEVVNEVIRAFLNDVVPAGNAVSAEVSPIRLPKSQAAAEENADEKNAVYEEKKSLAEKSLERGMSAEEVSELTELPLEDVEQLR